MAQRIARQVVASGDDAERVAREIVEGLLAPDLRCAFVFADWRLDPAAIARVTQHGLRPAPVVGGSTVGVLGPIDAATAAGITDRKRAVGMGLYGDAFRVGIGVAPELPKSPLTRSRDAVHQAAAGMGTTATALDATRHVAITVYDSTCGFEEAFCIGSAAAAPQIRFIGGGASSEAKSQRKPHVWVRGEVTNDAGVVVLLQSDLPFVAMSSTHLVPTERRTVVTAASGRIIEELDGIPATSRLRQLLAPEAFEHPIVYGFARYIDSVPYVRSITHFEGERIHVASAVEVGHVLRIMRPDDMIASTSRDLALAADRVGTLRALLAFSCIGRHLEASARGLARDLDNAYAAHPVAGFQSFGEQSGMVLVNHTLTGLAIGEGPR
ncbi:MAG: FIST C-terminal domain-containing protein [Deltaproteobacteria bacterium]|nr:FIST C-terminal domain-containing protein [Deltaproteobacteria bacterium]MCW5803375.1 FIST C-terminal domain-containing protein [Deltaproteobacteria bacterium]